MRLSDQIANSFGDGFEQVYPLVNPGEGGEATETTDASLVVVRFDAGHPLRFLLRNSFISDPFPPKETDGWGAFADESGRGAMVASIMIFMSPGPGPDSFSELFESLRARGKPAEGETGTEGGAKPEAEATADAAAEATGTEERGAEAGSETDEEQEGELVPAYAYAVFEQVRKGFSLAGVCIVLAKAPEGPYVTEEGETFEATSAPWLRIATDCYDPNSDEGPLTHLVAAATEGLRAKGTTSFFTLLSTYYGANFAGLDAKMVATVEVDSGDGIVSVVEVKLPGNESAVDEPAAADAVHQGEDDGTVEGAARGVVEGEGDGVLERPVGEGDDEHPVELDAAAMLPAGEGDRASVTA
jgi:hypothetical protein